MRRRTVKWWKVLALIVGGGMVFDATALGFTRSGLGGFSCQSERFLSNGLASSVDMCYLFDCSNNFLGGAVVVCDPNNSSNNIFLDCPNTTTTTTNTTTTTQ